MSAIDTGGLTYNSARLLLLLKLFNTMLISSAPRMSLVDDAMCVLAHKLSLSSDFMTPARLDEALQAVFDIGLLPNTRNTYGESLCELAARKKSHHTCMTLLALGINPFEDTLCADELGLRARLRGFESMIAANLGSCVLKAASKCSSLELVTHQESWHILQTRTHPQLRLWALGASWMHLAAAARAPRSICALGVLGLNPNAFDNLGHSPLQACLVARHSPFSSVVVCVEALLRLGANPWQTDLTGACPADSMPSQWLGLAARSQARGIESALSEHDLDACPARSARRL